jgi:hypothetical protein
VVDVVLLFGKLLFIALLYLFLFAAVRTGIGLVGAGTASTTTAGAGTLGDSGLLALVVARGPKELKGVRLPLDAPVVIGRTPESDIVIADDFVSSRHARVTPGSRGPVLEDLGSTNGTVLNGATISRPTTVRDGDIVELGEVVLKVERL